MVEYTGSEGQSSITVVEAVHKTSLNMHAGDTSGAARSSFSTEEEIWVYGTLRDDDANVGLGGAQIFIEINGLQVGLTYTDDGTGNFRYSLGRLVAGNYIIKALVLPFQT